MYVSRANKRYAVALHQSASDAGALEVFYQDMRDIRSTLERSRELRTIIASPVLSKEKKRDLVDALFTGAVSSFTLGVLRFLVEKNREGGLLEIIAHLESLQREADNIVVADVVTVEPLGESQRSALQGRLHDLTGKTVEIEARSDPSIVGGMVVRLNDTVYDGSVARKLERLRKRFILGA